jgi:magnesium transporter
MGKEPIVHELTGLRSRLASLDVVETAAELAHMAPAERATAFRLLAKGRALNVFQLLDTAHQEELLSGLRDEQTRQLIEAMDPDDRARLFDEMPAMVVKKLLAGLSPREQRLTSLLLGYPEKSAGRIMTPEFVTLRAEMTVNEALAKIRQRGALAETILVLPVTDDELHLRGVASLSALVLAEPSQRVAAVMDPEARQVRVDDDQEKVARLMQAADLIAVPVVDLEGRLVGIVTVDDAMDILGAEEGEDLARAGGAEPLGRPYFSVSVFRLAHSRVVWLLVLLVAAALTVQVLSHFEETLAAVVALALFIPLLINTGGNCGAQSATTVIRAMATNEVRSGDLLRVVFRETLVGLLLGAMLGALSLLPVAFIAGQAIALVVAVTLMGICTLATLTGSVLPLWAERLGIDPAIASAPFVTTLIDVIGLMLYFIVAGLVLGL